MKKLMILMTFMFSLSTPTFADFTLEDLFISGGTDKPVETKDNKKKDHDC